MSSTSPSPPLTNRELVTMAGPIIFFGILLPTVDNLTDLRMIIRLYSGINGCNYVIPYGRLMNGTTWEDLYTCQQDPDTYCQLNDPESWYCKDFYHRGSPVHFPNCTLDFNTCKSDPATFCEDNPNRLTCGHYKHVTFATMFLGIFYHLTVNSE